MQSDNNESLLNYYQKWIVISLIIVIIFFLFTFRNLFFQPTLLLKNLGELSIEPEVAFTNNKPTFLEFYAEWCEVCKEMAPKISSIRKQYDDEINFVFLNVDNPKWENYVRKFNVNGIPQVNLFNSQGNLEYTYIGKHDEISIKNSIEELNEQNGISMKISNQDFSSISKGKKYQISPLSHG